MSTLPEALTAWVGWASSRIGERYEKVRWHLEEGRRALAEEELLIASAMFELLSGFKRMVLERDDETPRPE